jgi:hypothetical protein
MAMGKPWTCAEERRLRDAISSGMSRVDICEMLGREKDTVRRKCHRLGLLLPPTVKTFNYEDRVFDQSPDAVARSTARLGEAINAFIATLDQRTIADCLGIARAVAPGAERVLQTCAVERLAA